MSPKFYDQYGNEKDADWVIAEFGNIAIRRGFGLYRVHALREIEGPISLVVTVLDKDGNPVGGQKVAFYWPDAPQDDAAGWEKRCVWGTTDTKGQVGFGMGGGAWYKPPDSGPHSVWLYGPNTSDKMQGLGMIFGSNHRHLDVTFKWTETPQPPEPPTPEPPTDFETAVLERLDTIIGILSNV